MKLPRGSIWKFNEDLTSRLLVWGAFSVAIGLSMFLMENPFWTGFASQAVVWGGIDALLAILGIRASRKKQAALLPTTIDVIETGHRHPLHSTSLGNAILDVLYVTGGVWLIATQSGALVQGIGWGIVVQGGFLLIFDLIHAILCPKP